MLFILSQKVQQKTSLMWEKSEINIKGDFFGVILQTSFAVILLPSAIVILKPSVSDA